MKNLRTTILGIASGVILILTQVVNLLDADPETAFSLTIVLTGLALAGVGVAAKDAKD